MSKEYPFAASKITLYSIAQSVEYFKVFLISRDVNFLLPCPSAAIQGQVLFVALERINVGYIVQNAFIPHNVGGRYVRAVI